MIVASGVSTAQDSVTLAASESGEGESDSTAVEIFRQSGGPTTTFDANISRQDEIGLRLGQSVSLTLAPFHSHRGYRIFNRGWQAATLVVNLGHPSMLTTYILPPDGAVLLPPYTGPGFATGFGLSIQNGGSQDSLAIGLDELGYDYPVALSANSPAFTCQFVNSPLLDSRAIAVTIAGHDPSPGGRVSVVARSPGAMVVSVDEPSPAPHEPLAFRLGPVGPNPFQETASFTFDLAREGVVEGSIHDLQGRPVRTIVARRLAPGRHVIEWDGLGADRRALTPGVYLFRFALDDRSVGAGKLVHVR